MPTQEQRADELHKLHLGNLIVQVINLQAALEEAAKETRRLKDKYEPESTQAP